MSQPRILIWNEFRHEKTDAAVQAHYPDGIHQTLARAMSALGAGEVRVASLDEPDNGLPEALLQSIDVLIWWGHRAHDEVGDEVVDRVQRRVLAGMGLVVLHSAHYSRPFTRLMGTSCSLKWRVHPGEREILWVTRPGHPIVEGIDDRIVLAEEEMYGEFFDIPEPETVFLISSFTGGEVFRSGCAWTRGAGKVVYLRPGHETFPTYHHPQVQRLIYNATRWAAPAGSPPKLNFGKRPFEAQ